MGGGPERTNPAGARRPAPIGGVARAPRRVAGRADVALVPRRRRPASSRWSVAAAPRSTRSSCAPRDRPARAGPRAARPVGAGRRRHRGHRLVLPVPRRAAGGLRHCPRAATSAACCGCSTSSPASTCPTRSPTPGPLRSAGSPTSSGFLYTRYPAGAEYGRQVYEHRLGTAWADDPLVWDALVEPEAWADVSVSPDGWLRPRPRVDRLEPHRRPPATTAPPTSGEPSWPASTAAPRSSSTATACSGSPPSTRPAAGVVAAPFDDARRWETLVPERRGRDRRRRHRRATCSTSCSTDRSVAGLRPSRP